MSLSSQAIGAKARAMYGCRLKKEDYQELINKNSVSEVASYLKHETSYSEVLQDVRELNLHRNQLEQLLKKDLYIKCQRLSRYADPKTKKFYEFQVRTQELSLILSCIRSLNSNEFVDFLGEIPTYISMHTRFDFLSLMNVRTKKELLSVLKGTPYHKILQPILLTDSLKIDYLLCERVLRKYFYDELFKTIHFCFNGKTKKDLIDIFQSEIELHNICKIYRLKKYFNASSSFINDSLIPINSRMNSSFMNSLIHAKDDHEMMKILENSPYHYYVGEKDYVFIEYYENMIKYHLGQRYMRFSTNASIVFVTYYVLHSLEIENIINIVEGVRYNVPPEKIEEVLIYE